MNSNSQYMEMALKIAFSRMAFTSPNPPVGAVIVKNNAIVSTGGTQAYGLDHAEVTAIKNAGDADLNHAEMYVTLEPCSHFGKTPPCTQAIISSGINHVFICVQDPNPLVAGKGIEQLRKAGVAVTLMSEFQSAGEDLLQPFFSYMSFSKPFIIHKVASTIDGYTAAVTGDSKWISSQLSRYIVHKLRSRMDAIIVGKNTFNNDSPALNVRLDDFSIKEIEGAKVAGNSSAGYENYFLKLLLAEEIVDYKDPLRVVFGLPFPEVLTEKFLQNNNYLIFTTEAEYSSAYKGKVRDLLNRDNIYILEGSNSDSRVKKSLSVLADKGILSVLLEGGAHLAGSFFNTRSINQVLYFYCPKLLGSGKKIIEGNPKNYECIGDAPELENISVYNLDRDILYSGYPKYK